MDTSEDQLAVQGSVSSRTFSEAEVLHFLGFLSADIQELNSIEIPRFVDSWDKFKKITLSFDQPKLTPVEVMALHIAIGMLQRGELPLPGMSAVCIMTLARLTETPFVVIEGV